MVVRYSKDDDEQLGTKHHFDSSMVTMQVALSKPGVDYQGGGTDFLR